MNFGNVNTGMQVTQPMQRPANVKVSNKYAGGIRQVRAKPGLLYDPTRKQFFKIVDTLQHAQYDTCKFQNVNGTVAFGTKVNFAQDISNKLEIDTNFTQPRRLTAGQVMWVSRVGIYFPPYVGSLKIDAEDIQTIAESTYFVLKVNQKEMLTGPTPFYPSGFGWYGSTVKSNDAVVSMGLPTLGGVLPLAKKIFLNEHYDLDGSLTVQSRGWLPIASVTDPVLKGGTGAADANALVLARLVLHGRLYRPSTV